MNIEFYVDKSIYLSEQSVIKCKVNMLICTFSFVLGSHFFSNLLRVQGKHFVI